MSDSIKIDTGGGNANITGSIIGSTGSTVTGQFALSDSLNTGERSHSNELEELLKNLVIAVDKMNEVLPEEERVRVARALEIVKSEAISEKPDRQWWSVSVEGLTKAAKNIGEIGKPVLDIVARIVPLLIQKSS